MPLFVRIVNNGIEKLGMETDPIYKDNDTIINDIYAFDGKEIKKTANKYKSGDDEERFNTLNVYSTEYQLALKAERIHRKTN